jgi:hypothetical protein
MDRKKIKQALDHFENDQYVDAKEIIQAEIAGERDVFLKNKLGLSQDINPVVSAADNNDNDNDNDSMSESTKDSTWYTQMNISNVENLYKIAKGTKNATELKTKMINMKHQFPDIKKIDFKKVDWNEVYDTVFDE